LLQVERWKILFNAKPFSSNRKASLNAYLNGKPIDLTRQENQIISYLPQIPCDEGVKVALMLCILVSRTGRSRQDSLNP
jgi:hypothetical protein